MRALVVLASVVVLGCSPRASCGDGCDAGFPVCDAGVRVTCAPCAERLCLPNGTWDYCRAYCDADDRDAAAP